MKKELEKGTIVSQLVRLRQKTTWRVQKWLHSKPRVKNAKKPLPCRWLGHKTILSFLCLKEYSITSSTSPCQILIQTRQSGHSQVEYWTKYTIRLRVSNYPIP